MCKILQEIMIRVCVSVPVEIHVFFFNESSSAQRLTGLGNQTLEMKWELILLGFGSRYMVITQNAPFIIQKVLYLPEYKLHHPKNAILRRKKCI